MKLIHVSVGVLTKIMDGERQYLFSQRPAGKPFAGFWEFAGGKIELGETPQAALARELKEEINIDIHIDINLNSNNLISYLMSPFTYQYPNYAVELHVFLINTWQGEPKAQENQNLHWSTLENCKNLQPMLDAADIILTQLKNHEKNHDFNI